MTIFLSLRYKKLVSRKKNLAARKFSCQYMKKKKYWHQKSFMWEFIFKSNEITHFSCLTLHTKHGVKIGLFFTVSPERI